MKNDDSTVSTGYQSDRVYIFDTTLRDGEQSPGATMTLQEKVRLARQLELLGVDIIEAGFPAASPGDFEAVRAVSETVTNCQVAGLCRAVAADIDRAWEALKHAANPRIHVFLATSPIHMEHKLRKTPDQVLEMAEKAVRHAASLTKNVEFSAEDASRSELPFLAKVVETVIDAGATTVNIPDTVGYIQPGEYANIIRYLAENVKNINKAVISVHCHDDLGLAVANSLAAVKAGARQIECTINGIGERAGNTAMDEAVMNLNVRSDYYQCNCGIITEQLYPTARTLSHIIGMPIPANKAIVGANAFAHESGIHQDGVLKCRETYEIMDAASIGKTGNDMVLGKHSGRHAIKAKVEELGYTLNDDQITIVSDAVKKLADIKKEIFSEDVEAIVLEEIFRMPDKFKLKYLQVHAGNGPIPPNASVIMEVNGEDKQLHNFGVGPIDAVFNTIGTISGCKPDLEQFSVNAITGGTDAQGEVTVRLRRNNYTAIGRGADPDILVAAGKAYVNALNRLAKKVEENHA
ncbi:2-isopropylmalate synthase [Methanorbis furvi]|uniref:2-isopropylmalate synthase n=1 Tax=Methanorbis furvi TaxID=3028299 RepID=A0AAE4MBX2_9EURY|nr:2-isopropylmalate synthase [Methanocorpusculaceae archaeon Ag1]